MTSSLFYGRSGARLDRLPVSKFHVRLAALIGAGLFFDGFDLFLGASILASLTKSGFSTLPLNGRFVTVTFIGMIVGAFLTGFIGDRFGRRVVYQLNLLIFCLASIAAALAPSMNFLIDMRFIMGIGLGAEIVVGYAAFSEFLPPAVRGRWLAVLALPLSSSLFIGALLALVVVPHFGWRPMFGLAALGSAIVWYLRKNIPESPRWLESRGRYEEADAILTRIEAECGSPLPADFVIPPRAEQPTVNFFTVEMLRRIFVAAVSISAVNVVGFGFLTFVPTFFVDEGFSITKSLGFSAVMMLGSPLGALIALSMADKIQRRTAIIITGLVTGAIGCFYPFAGSGVMIMVIGFFLVCAHYANSACCIAIYLPELFPTNARLRGVGLSHTVARIVSAVVPIVGIYLYSRWGIIGIIELIVGALVLQAAVVGFLGLEPSRQSFEALEILPVNNQS